MADYRLVRDENNEVCGIWLRNPEQAQDRELFAMLLTKHNAPDNLGAAVLAGDFRIVPNTHDAQGGLFVMFGSTPTLGDSSAQLSGWGQSDGKAALVKQYRDKKDIASLLALLNDPNQMSTTIIAVANALRDMENTSALPVLRALLEHTKDRMEKMRLDGDDYLGYDIEKSVEEALTSAIARLSRQNCIGCGALILPQTAKINEGLCLPCARSSAHAEQENTKGRYINLAVCLLLGVSGGVGAGLGLRLAFAQRVFVMLAVLSLWVGSVVCAALWTRGRKRGVEVAAVVCAPFLSAFFGFLLWYIHA
jgi:hypothetical protein